MTPISLRVLRRAGIMVLAAWPLLWGILDDLGRRGPHVDHLAVFSLTLPVTLLAWRGRSRWLRAASFVGASVLFGAWMATLGFLVAGRPSGRGGGILGLFDDPVRDVTASVSIMMCASGALGAALLAFVEWSWERLGTGRNAPARVRGSSR